MKLSEAGQEIERFRKNPLKHQRTFQTPLKDLPRFLATILSPFHLEHGVLTVELVVFEPKNLLGLLASHSLSAESVPAEYFMHVTITAAGREEVASLLEAALGDSVDFIFVPTPAPFTIFAEHDEFTTFFSNEDSDLSILASALVDNGFRAITGYTREF
jgi:hypothetical protein